jgi:DNA-binding GntR family transcriptional regulator
MPVNRVGSDRARPATLLRAGRNAIRQGNLHDEVAAILREMIVQDELPPGTRIPEAELCQRLGISRTPLREAIRVLASEGLVTPLPRRGAVVAVPTREEVHGLFLALGAIEFAAAPLACENLTDAEIAAIRKQHKQMVDHFRRARRKDYYRANQLIHQAIVKGARNQFLSDLHESLGLRVLRVRFFIDVPKNSWSRALREHEQIMTMIERREGRKLAEMMLQHMMGSWRDFELTLERPRIARGYFTEENAEDHPPARRNNA